MRPRAKNLVSEPPYPGLDTVVFLTFRPDFPLTVHAKTARCDKDYPHEIAECAEWQVKPESPANQSGNAGDTEEDSFVRRL